MDLIRLAITRPIATLAAVFMVVMLGLVALQSIPVQLTPDVRNPIIQITTRWAGAAPVEIEREIINTQEENLKGLDGLKEMSSSSTTGRGRITLEFAPGQDMTKALLLVANRLDRVSTYPDEANEPTLSTSGSEDSPIAWFMIRAAEGNTALIDDYGDFIEDTVKDTLERLPGVGGVNVYGGAEKELQIIVNPQKLAAYQLTIPDMITALRAANVSLSAGTVDEGKRRYVVRLENELTTPQRVENTIVRLDTTRATPQHVYVRDVAQVAYAYKEMDSIRRYRGKPMIALNVVRETGANVIRTMEEIKAAIKDLQTGILAQEGITIKQVYDETTYIEDAIDLVIQNIIIGGLLAAAILLIFLRTLAPTIIITFGIPISVIGSFVAMSMLGRSINVISLAGLAFAVGMVVDAAIVVLENIYKHREQGLSRMQAAYQGAKQVWGAILVSALTTVMVFAPILTIELEVGQLFRDIAVAISVAVILSLLVAVTVIPAMARYIMGPRRQTQARLKRQKTDRPPKGTQPAAVPNRPDEISSEQPNIRIPILDPMARSFTNFMCALAARSMRSRIFALCTVVLVVGSTSLASLLLLPKMEYLPEGNRNMVFGRILPPPGYNLDTTTHIADNIETAVRPYWAVQDPKTGAAILPDHDTPAIDNFFFVALRNFAFIGATAANPEKAADLIPIIRTPMFSEPGTYGFVTQPSLFGRSVGSGRSVQLDITGNNMADILAVAQRATAKLMVHFPSADGNQFRPKPGLELGAPEIRITPKMDMLSQLGLSARSLGQTVDTFNDGLRIAEITAGNERMDLTLAGPKDYVQTTQGIGALPVVSTGGDIVPLQDIATVSLTAGPTEILRKEGRRTISLEVRPAKHIALEQAMETIATQIIPELTQEGLPPSTHMAISGTADKLNEAWGAMKWQLVLALGIVYLVMAVLFESFKYPLLIMITVPTASAGAILTLGLLNTFSYQALDMLTLLGFVILVGIVVNNAILLVHQSLHHQKHGLTLADAVVCATRDRMRPIFMSTLTSLFGMAPLVFFPGAGSELYRGLGAVVLGGLGLSALLTLIIMPSLISLFEVLKPNQQKNR
jgi:HAE1 family hydrophobic/amphiphilic exporter-1